jgi:hypothetical protein
MIFDRIWLKEVFVKRILFMLILLGTVGIYAQTIVSQVNPVAETTLNVAGFNPVFANVESDGSLVFYDTMIDTVSISIRQVICSHEGIISEIQPVMTYTSPTSWETEPRFVKTIQKNSFTYIYLNNPAQIFIFKIPDIAINTIPTVHVFENQGVSNLYLYHGYEQLGDITYYISSIDYNLHALNLSSDAQYTAMSYTAPNNMQMALLGDEYLLIYAFYTANLCAIIDMDGDVTNPVNNIQQPYLLIDDTQADIGGGIYPASWSDGLLRTSIYGYVEYSNGQIRLVGLGSDDPLGPPYPSQYNCIPLGNQRFLCIEHYIDASYYQTYQFSNDQFVADTNFPYLDQTIYHNVVHLFKTSDRYIVGISLTQNNIRPFVCIDLEDQTIQTTQDTLETGTPDWNFYIYYGADYIYYSYYNHSIQIYAVQRVTGTSDNTLAPVISSVSSYPNPFRGSTEIVLKGSSSKATVSIYNIKGQVVRKLDVSDKTAADKHFTWDGKNSLGMNAPAGIYLYQVVGDNNKKFSGKMVKVE